MANKKAKGVRSKSRSKLKMHSRCKTTINALLREFGQGARVQININPSIQAGMPMHKYQGITGVVSGRQGDAFVVSLRDQNKEKKLIVPSAHLKQVY
ncbi:50S ribosomal protein L21e [archaeon]|nr:50S ribosomal protein L21e [archaeon]